MARRLIIRHSESRSETIQTHLDLLLDDPPSGSRLAVRPALRGATLARRLDALATLGETENDR